MAETVALPLTSAQLLLDRLGPELRCSGVAELQQAAVDLVDAIEFRPQARLAADMVSKHQATAAGLAPNARARADRMQAMLAEVLVPAGVDPADPRVAAELILLLRALEGFAAHWAASGLITDPPLQVMGLIRTVAIAVADMPRTVTW